MISLVSKPVDWARVNDTNRCTYTFSSNNYTKPNFNFLFELYTTNYNGSSTIKLGTFFQYPLSGGTCQFNPTPVYKNYLSYDFNVSQMHQVEALNSAKKFKMVVSEYYGTPPVKLTGGTYTETPIVFYNGCQANIAAYDDITIGSGNLQWVVTGSCSGKFLTDVTEYRFDNNDYGFLYFLADTAHRPTRIRYTVFYWNVTGWEIDPGGGALIDKLIGLPNSEVDTPSLERPVPNPMPITTIEPLPPVRPPIPHPNPHIDSYTTFDNLTYLSNEALMYYIPVGPLTLLQENMITNANNWLYYKVDILSGNTQLNKDSFYVYRKEKCDKWGRFQIFFLNSHGAFDCYTFDRPNDINYKIERSTYKQRLLPGYNTYAAGERIFSTNSVEEITLRSNLVTQKESQLLIQLCQSPVVYVIKQYRYDSGPYPYSIYPYGVPYIIVSNEIKYEQKNNTKEIYYEIKIRPSNPKIIQQD